MCPRSLRTVWFGSFVLEGSTVVDKVLFEKDPEAIARRLALISKEKVLEEERRLVERHSPENTAEQRLVQLGLVLTTSDWSPAPGDYGYPMTLLAQASRLAGGMKTREETSPDMYIIQALESYDTLMEVRNLLMERLRNYYSLHWPDLVEDLPEDRFIKLISAHGDRDGIVSSGETDLPDTEPVTGIPTDHVGAVKDLASLIDGISSQQLLLESRIGAQMGAVASNLSAVCGPLIGARLISLAGGLGRLSKLPSSTVQVLGAEKAMFRSKKERTRKPKHGVIFMHPLIRTAPFWRRGNIARALAGKASIAAKVDFNNGEFMGDGLREDLERKVKAINERYPEPPRGKK